MVSKYRNAALIMMTCSLLSLTSYSQLGEAKSKFNYQDTLRGSIGEGRIGWDVLHYDITVEPDYATKTLKGKNIIRYMDNGVKLMQIDMQEPMIIDSVISNNKSLEFRREGNVYWTEIRDPKAMYKIKPGKATLTIYFHGKPVEAKRPPWDGGWIWRKDKKGNAWMSAACQGLGASVWYPCKDTQTDEPDNGATLRIVVDDTLTAVGNGRMLSKNKRANGKTTFVWEVKDPINNYNIIPYIGKYTHFGESYKGEKGKLDLDYWVLDYNLDKAKTQFKDVNRMMKAFENWFGPYPFYKDGFKLVESPHLGMEHQSAVAYGNGYQNGYLGRDLSGTGWGKKFDFIIIHESGHEWFANNITTRDIADMWVHEGFTNYSETLFLDYHYGKDAGNAYVIGTRANIANDIPIIGTYGVNKEGSGDMYYKAGNMLHLIRQIVNNDNKFREILRGLNKTYYHKITSSAEVEAYISKHAKFDFSKLFDQYLRTTKVPELEYKIDNTKVSFRYVNVVPGFSIPVKTLSKKHSWIKPNEQWQTLDMGTEASSFKIDSNFYIKQKLITEEIAKP